MSTTNLKIKKEANLGLYQNFYLILIIRTKKLNFFIERISP
jgi:hypothetical protein